MANLTLEEILQNCEVTKTNVLNLLHENKEWESRYSLYGEKILRNEVRMVDKKKLFNEPKPFCLYSNITEAKGRLNFSLRFRGQDVATIRVDKDNQVLLLPKKNSFEIGTPNSQLPWKEATEYRKEFKDREKAMNEMGPDIQDEKCKEHKLESMLLSEFSITKSADAALYNIQPVKLSKIARFQMPTPLSASKSGQITYSAEKGGGIDILARVGQGRGVKLCVMELKDETKSNERPEKVIQQALAYAIFIQQLLRSKTGKDWWKIFGFKGSIPKSLKINVACVMPFNEKDQSLNSTNFGGHIINIDQDQLQLHYLYFHTNRNQITSPSTSMTKDLKINIPLEALKMMKLKKY